MNGSAEPRLDERRCVILAACPVSEALRGAVRETDFVIACDAGYRNAAVLGIEPDLIVGDFDSAPQPAGVRLVVLPHVKDDTDTQYAARWALEHGAREVLILGGLGGDRLDHTVASFATGLYLAKHGVRTELRTETTSARYLLPGQELVLPRGAWRYLSVFPAEGALSGVTMSGVFYPLREALLTADYPLGVSNEFTEETARLSCRQGCGLVILTSAE